MPPKWADSGMRTDAPNREKSMTKRSNMASASTTKITATAALKIQLESMPPNVVPIRTETTPSRP